MNVDGSKDFNHSNVGKSLVILLNEFLPRELCPDTVNWEIKVDHSSKVSFGLDEKLSVKNSQIIVVLQEGQYQ